MRVIGRHRVLDEGRDLATGRARAAAQQGDELLARVVFWWLVTASRVLPGESTVKACSSKLEYWRSTDNVPRARVPKLGGSTTTMSN